LISKVVADGTAV